MARVILSPEGPDFAEDGRLAGTGAYARHGDLEMTIRKRLYNVILTVGPAGLQEYREHWCYDRFDDAVEALQEWDPAVEEEPEGWFRHAASGRRRPGGDKNQEYVNP